MATYEEREKQIQDRLVNITRTTASSLAGSYGGNLRKAQPDGTAIFRCPMGHTFTEDMESFVGNIMSYHMFICPDCGICNFKDFQQNQILNTCKALCAVRGYKFLEITDTIDFHVYFNFKCGRCIQENQTELVNMFNNTSKTCSKCILLSDAQVAKMRGE
jgi:hypothetical protein